MRKKTGKGGAEAMDTRELFARLSVRRVVKEQMV